MEKSRNIGDMWLNMVYPFCIMYLCVIFIWNIIGNGVSPHEVFDMVLLTVLGLGFLYGVLAILKELKEHGKLETIIYWIKKIRRNEDITGQNIQDRQTDDR